MNTIFQKFSLSQAIGYGFRTYFNNIRFFLKFLIATMLGSAVFSVAGIEFKGFFVLLNMVIVILNFCWYLGFSNLALKEYEHMSLSKFADLWKYDSNVGGYFLYYIFISFIQHLAQAILYAARLFDARLALGLMFIVSIPSIYFYITYALGQFLLLDRNLTFRQTVIAMPYLVSGEKLKLLWATGLSYIIPTLSILPFVLLVTITTSRVIDGVTIVLFLSPVWFAFVYPLALLIQLSIYKQLMENADDYFKEGLQELEHINNEDYDEEEIDEEEIND